MMQLPGLHLASSPAAQHEPQEQQQCTPVQLHTVQYVPAPGCQFAQQCFSWCMQQLQLGGSC